MATLYSSSQPNADEDSFCVAGLSSYACRSDAALGSLSMPVQPATVLNPPAQLLEIDLRLDLVHARRHNDHTRPLLEQSLPQQLHQQKLAEMVHPEVDLCSRVNSGVLTASPALFTRQYSCGTVRTSSRAKLRIERNEARSSSIGISAPGATAPSSVWILPIASFALARLRHAITTVAWRRTSALVVSYPSPVLAPVMTNVLPRREKLDFTQPHLRSLYSRSSTIEPSRPVAAPAPATESVTSDGMNGITGWRLEGGEYRFPSSLLGEASGGRG
uniref:Uncharacterized protein n=1 Tax=Anopheles merus TaxID=30066 RepID=A0A182UR92_ANOME